MSMGLFAANPTFDSTESQAHSASNSVSEAASDSASGRNVDSPGDDLSTNGDSVLTANSKKGGSAYTFSDFFDALDLPTVLGAGVTPNGIESATFNSSLRGDTTRGMAHTSSLPSTPTATHTTRSPSMVPMCARARCGTMRLVWDWAIAFRWSKTYAPTTNSRISTALISLLISNRACRYPM